MEDSTKRTAYVGPPCLTCRYDTLVVPCICDDCPRWVVLCGGCSETCERFIETEGRCEYCRVQ